MDFKVGDNVRPLDVMYVSNKQMMETYEEGTIMEIIPRVDGHYLLVVKRNRDDAIFKANEYLWEKA